MIQADPKQPTPSEVESWAPSYIAEQRRIWDVGEGQMNAYDSKVSERDVAEQIDKDALAERKRQRAAAIRLAADRARHP
jgi:hypothetical protein